jgi:hypothetical protein
VYSLEGHLLYRMHRRYWARGLWLGRECKNCSQVVVAQGGVVQGFSAVVCAASLAIMPALARRLQKHLIQLLLM